MGNEDFKTESAKGKNEYIPGTCNLGRQETALRRKNAISGFVFTLATMLFLQLTHHSKEWKLLIVFPLFYFIICLLETRKKFCVYYGMRRIFNFEKVGKYTKIENEEYIKLDRKLAIQMAITAFLLSLAVTIIYYLLPV